MATANIHNRVSIEAAYAQDDFAVDAARNELPSALVHGVRVVSAPDAAGDFELEPATQHVGEAPNAAFLAPGSQCESYSGFLDAIIAAAIRHGFAAEASPGPDDPRLRGLRQ